MTAHTLRHTAATWLRQATGDTRLVAEYLGHADLSTVRPLRARRKRGAARRGPEHSPTAPARTARHRRPGPRAVHPGEASASIPGSSPPGSEPLRRIRGAC